MNKNLIIYGVAVLLVCVGLSGCNDVDIHDDSIQILITSFEVVPDIINQGETANLSWVVVGATSVSIDNGIGNVSLTGNRIIMPTETTNYTLTASNSTTNLTATTQIILTESTGHDEEEEPESQRYTLTIEIIGSGEVVKYPNQVTYVYDTIVDLTANPEFNWIFTGWSGDITSSNNPETIIIDSNKMIIATFEEEPPEQHRVSGILYISDTPAPEGVEVRLYDFVTGFTDMTGYYQLDFEDNEGIATFQVYWDEVWYAPIQVRIQSGVYEVKVDLYI